MLANILSLSRIFLCIPLLYSLRRGDEMTLTTVSLLFLAAATDLGDGFVARRLKQVSRVGKMLDPLSDKVFLTCLLGGLVLWGTSRLGYCLCSYCATWESSRQAPIYCARAGLSLLLIAGENPLRPAWGSPRLALSCTHPLYFATC